MTNQAISAAALPWQLMVSPVKGWQEARLRQGLLHALLWQWIMLCLAELVALPAMQQISNPAQAESSWLKTIGIIIGFLPLTLLLNAAFAALSWLFFKVVGLPRSYADFLQWTALGMLPFTIGAFLGRLSLEFLQPAHMHHGLLAPLQFRGISAGPVNWFTALGQPVDFAWVSLSYLDVFGLWSLIVLAIGLRHYLKASRTESMLASLALGIMSMLLLTGVWQLFQRLGSEV